MITVKELIDFLKQFPDDFGVFKYGHSTNINYASMEDSVICLFDILTDEDTVYYDFHKKKFIHNSGDD